MVPIVRDRAAQARALLPPHKLHVASPSESATFSHRVEEDLKIRLRFVVGHLQDPADQAAVDEEQRVHSDFLVVNVQETYDNLVLKASATDRLSCPSSKSRLLLLKHSLSDL